MDLMDIKDLKENMVLEVLQGMKVIKENVGIKVNEDLQDFKE